jgi:thiol:disulfide interchange protein DsbA
MKRLSALFISWIFAAVATTAPVNSFAAEPQAGREYTLVEPIQPPAVPGKIDVVEFFSYGCPHCSDFHPVVNSWANKLPKDVSFRRVPVSFNRPAWARLAAIFYALETTGDLAKLDTAVFLAIHEQRINFSSDEMIANWAASKGADKAKVAEALASFSLQSRIKRGDQEAAAFKIQGVPAIAVGGRYLINNNATESHTALLQTADALIAKVRNEGAAKGK